MANPNKVAIFVNGKRKRKMLRRSFLIALVLLLLCACSSREPQRLLDRAEAVMNEKPSKAIALLDSISDDGLTRSQRMRRLLLLTNAQNKCDTIFRSDSIQRMLVEYYDSHGTANERMLAKYLLGRAYYDMGEMPMSLNAYQSALADTTGTEQDYYLLSRIYSQMANIYYHQNLLSDQIDCINRSVKYAIMDRDTLGAVYNYLQKANSFDVLGMTDSVITICEKVYSFFLNNGMKRQSSQVLSLLGLHYIKKGMLEKAKQCLEIYEAESGFFNYNHDIEKNREVYYSILGEYYIAKEKYDSAEFFFRKELRKGKDFNNQNAASRGLALLFQKTHQPDSAAKYALYSYAMNDSVYAHMATQEVERMKAIYDYTRHQELAHQAEKESERKTAMLRWILFISLLVLSAAFYIAYKYKQKKQYEARLFKNRIAELEKTQSDILMLRQHEEEYRDAIKEKEQAICQLQEQIEKYQQNHRQKRTELQAAKESLPLFRKIQKQEANGQILSKEDLQKLRQYVIENYPSCYKFISEKDFNLNMMEFNTCILIRLGYAPKVISHFLDCSPAYISKIRITLLKKMYEIEGKPQEFDQKLELLN
ncbi:MAG: hypothetical protein IJK46_01540 [Prevotella sp.]|nr:hypothetical protein [Prevotella sp.]